MTLPLGDGLPNAKIFIVGEAWGESEEKACRPFVGASGQELDRMLHEAGIMRSETYCSNLVNQRPEGNDISTWVAMKKKEITPRHVMLKDKFVLPIVVEGYASLLKEIDLVNPNIIVPVGNFALWALTGKWGILKWRGSQLYSDTFPYSLRKRKTIPTIHPAAILREYSLRRAAIQDLKRAAVERATEDYVNVPYYSFTLRPNLQTVVDKLRDLAAEAEAAGHLWIEFDLETSPKHITCAGISWSRTEAMCIPITCAAGNYWTEDEEAVVIYTLYRFLTNPKVWVRGQNLLYDCQHTYRHWHFIPNVKQDTMLSHHSMFCGMKKSLDFQASLYADYYVYWKEMHKDLSNKEGA